MEEFRFKEEPVIKRAEKPEEAVDAVVEGAEETPVETVVDAASADDAPAEAPVKRVRVREAVTESMDDYTDEIEASLKRIYAGDVMECSVVAVDETAVSVDLDYYAPGKIPVEDMSADPLFSVFTDVQIGDQFKAIVTSADDGAGNIVLSKKEADAELSWEKLEQMMEEALQMDLDRGVYDRFCADLERGKKLLYLTDNAGEIGFDRIFAEAIHERYPQLQITFCVRGDIAGNDALREDAAAVGIPFPVSDSGDRTAGTLIPRLGSEAREALEGADVILAKGMANTETMHGCGYNVYYAFLVKCQRFVNLFGKPMFTPIFTPER